MLNNDFLSLSDAIPKPTDELLILLVTMRSLHPRLKTFCNDRISFTYTLKFPPFDVVHEVGADINKGKKEKRKKAMRPDRFGFQNKTKSSKWGNVRFPSGPCHMEQTPIPCTLCRNNIPVQNSAQNHTIPLSPWTKFLLFPLPRSYPPPPPPPPPRNPHFLMGVIKLKIIFKTVQEFPTVTLDFTLLLLKIVLLSRDN